MALLELDTDIWTEIYSWLDTVTTAVMRQVCTSFAQRISDKLKIQDLGRCSIIDLLYWLLYNKYIRVRPNVAKEAGKACNTVLITWIQNIVGDTYNLDISTGAASVGNVDLLSSFPFDKSWLEEASKTGRTNVFEWAKRTGNFSDYVQTNIGYIINTVKLGHEELFRWFAITIGVHVLNDYALSITAVESNQIGIMNALWTLGFAWEDHARHCAIRYGRLKILQWIYDHRLLLDTGVYYFVIGNIENNVIQEASKIETCEWLFAHGFTIPRDIIQIEGIDPDLLTWFQERI